MEGDIHRYFDYIAKNNNQASSGFSANAAKSVRLFRPPVEGTQQGSILSSARSLKTTSLAQETGNTEGQKQTKASKLPPPPSGYTSFNTHPLDFAPGFVNPYEEERVPWPSVKVTGYRMRLALMQGFKDEELEQSGIPKEFWSIFKERENLPKRKIVKEALTKFGTNEQDTGRTEVQAITKHLNEHKKDFSTRRGMMLMIGRRRRLLRYLEREDPVRYHSCIQTLKLRPLRNLYAKNVARYTLLAKRGKDK